MYSTDEIISKADLPRIAENAGAVLRYANHEWRGACPLHRGSNETGFVIYEDGGKQRWTCFSGDCGSGDVIDFVMKLKGCDFLAACEWLGGEKNPDPREVERLTAERLRREREALERQVERAQNTIQELRRAETWVAYHENLLENEHPRELWRERGIPDDMQTWWQLGYARNFTVKSKAGLWTTDTLSIPIFSKGWELTNVRHRLLNPPTPTDKYRPDRPGLVAAPFIGDPEIGFDTERILWVEGEIKAMVTMITLDIPGFQVAGIPGKSNLRMITDSFNGQDIWICLDPDAGEQAVEAARAVGGRIIKIPVKIDDAILAGYLDKTGLRRLIQAARKMK